jgi:hypothetical protein
MLITSAVKIKKAYFKKNVERPMGKLAVRPIHLSTINFDENQK